MEKHSKLLKKTLKEISKLAYEILEVNDKLVRQVHEDAISSIILKKIGKLKEHGLSVTTKSLNVKEGTTGMDFDLWIGQNDEEYIRFIVQAKSFGNKTDTDDKYEFNKIQCNKLISHAKKEHSAFPLYFLYQHIDDKNLKKNHFSFLKDFKDEYSSITFTSAENIKQAISNTKIKFSEIHTNEFEHRWKNDIYEIFQNKKQNIGLPLYLLYDVSPEKIKKFQKLISDKENSLGFFFFFFFFFFGEEMPFNIHKITSKEILEIYGNDKKDGGSEFKNLIIINDNDQFIAERNRTIKKIMKK